MTYTLDARPSTEVVAEMPSGLLHAPAEPMVFDDDSGRALSNLEMLARQETNRYGGEVFVGGSGRLSPEAARANSELNRSNLTRREKIARFIVPILARRPH